MINIFRTFVLKMQLKRGVQLSHQRATGASKRATNQKVKAVCNRKYSQNMTN